MKFLAIFLVILSVFNMMMVEADESTQKPLNRRRHPDFRADEGAWPRNDGIIIIGSPSKTMKDAKVERKPLYIPRGGRNVDRMLMGKSPATFKKEQEEYLRQQQQNVIITIGGKQQPTANVKLAGY
ncbi:hypothetical protein GCK72_015913 [Caenorhabditis remanei]|uniref:Uncharacterized protein n=1 Tax=Caenorhabditis remanei TaxID=31234 RepID=A0A6A5GXY4_CAERE|nr:hypothetical protein GCK72_015913 [Caenorhabditis remanei]KAF1759446.1 hypothetical protein GCK72_015913 [Caenorhabditis remanei]